MSSITTFVVLVAGDDGTETGPLEQLEQWLNESSEGSVSQVGEQMEHGLKIYIYSANRCRVTAADVPEFGFNSETNRVTIVSGHEYGATISTKAE